MAGIDEAALRRIEAAITDAERATAGEIVVAIAPKSASWSGARTALALALAVVAGVILSRVFPLHAGWMALAVGISFALAWLLAGLAPVTRLLVGGPALDAAVLRAAKVAFVDHGVHATKDRAGVLVYLSMFERRVQVLADAGVHALVGEEGWSAYVERIGRAMKANDVDALVGVVRDVGAMLARSFPRTARDENELPDAVRATRAL